MKIKCENIVRCGNLNCVHNHDGYICLKTVVALDVNGRCAFCQPKSVPKDIAVAPNKSKPAFDVEASK